MGLNGSTLNGRDGAVPRETEIVATPFNGDRLFKIKVASPDVLAEGTSAALLKGKMLVSRNQRDTVDVALKVFRLPLNAEQKELYRRLYRRELEAAERLGTAERYILPYLGTSVLGYQPVIVSLYMRHGNLLDYFLHNDVDRQSMILQVAEALAFLHTEAGMVHGDLKCENVLVADDGTPRLADFGLSTLVDKAAEAGTTDASLRVWNTVRFAAPELLSDTAQSTSGRIRSKTTQSDVWAFGMLVVQAFTSNHPWPGFDNHVVAMKTLSGVQHPRPGDEATLRGLTDSWWDVCIKCWELAPERRLTIDRVLEELSTATGSSRSFGVDLAVQMERLASQLPNGMAGLGEYIAAPPVVMRLCTAIEKHGMDSTTTYRSEGPPRRAAKLKALLDFDVKLVDFDSPEWASDVGVVSEVLMIWLRELPEPVIIGSDLAKTGVIDHDTLRYIRAHEAVNMLPDANYAMLRFLLGHLCRMAQNEAVNLLTIPKLSILFTPVLFATRPARIQAVMGRNDVETTSDTFSKRFRPIRAFSTPFLRRKTPRKGLAAAGVGVTESHAIVDSTSSNPDAAPVPTWRHIRALETVLRHYDDIFIDEEEPPKPLGDGYGAQVGELIKLYTASAPII